MKIETALPQWCRNLPPDILSNKDLILTDGCKTGGKTLSKKALKRFMQSLRTAPNAR